MTDIVNMKNRNRFNFSSLIYLNCPLRGPLHWHESHKLASYSVLINNERDSKK